MAIGKNCAVALGVLVCLWGLALPGQAQPPAQKGRPEAAPARTPGGVQAYRDLEYVANGHERHKLDLFVPEKAGGPLPLIIWVHGGGWQNGSKEGCPPLRAGYTERGYAVASINYRLSGHAVFPAQIEDCKAAIRWLRAHAQEYHLDPQRFGVWGSSAGGHLVALLGTSGEVREFDKGAHLDQSSRVQAVCDYYGPTDFTVFVTTPGYEGHARAEAPEGKLIGGAVLENKDKAARVNPVTFVSKDDPSFLIVHGDEDRTVPINQSQLLFVALKKAGVSAHFHTIKGAGHGTGFGGPEIEPMVREFFQNHLKDQTPVKGTPEAVTSESTASAGATQPPAGSRPGAAPPANQRGPGLSFEQVLSRNDKDKDGKISREEFPAGPQLFERLDANKDGFVTREEHERAFPAQSAVQPQPPSKSSPSAQRGKGKATPADDKPQWVKEPVKAPNLHYKKFNSDTVQGEVSYLIYLPPGYEQDTDTRYPVTYWLHGKGGGQQGIPVMCERLTQAIEAKQAPPLIVVFPNGLNLSGWADSEGQPVETVCIKELLPLVDKSYRTIATREGRMVEGFSMGGSGAAKWGFKYPELFGSVSILAGARVGEGQEAWSLVEKNIDAIRDKSTVRIVVGSQDGLSKSNAAYHERLDALKVKHGFHVIGGAGHSPNPLYEGLGDNNWPFYVAAFSQAKASK